jgi:flagellar M-ring protein FliF
MRDSLNMLSKQTGEIWRQFGASQRLSIILSLLVAVATLGTLVYWSARPEYRVLYSNLTLEDSSKMREKLDEEKIPVKISQSGMSISVPASDLYTARLKLASEGLPGDSSIGFELFEQPKFGLTDFAQKVNYQRALQGELERTIGAMKGIRTARVMLVIPKEKLFSTEDERKAQASVLLNLNGALALSEDQVQSIVHLLASSVQNLEPSQVTVTDQAGHLLTDTSASGTAMDRGNDQLDVQERTEKRLVEKAQAILDRALGVGNSIVRVSVDLDFSDIEERNEAYDPENKVATSERIMTSDKTTSSNGRAAGGRAGIVANVAVDNPASMKLDVGGNKDSTEELFTEYAVPLKVSMVRQNGVRLSHLSVAVCLAQVGDTARTEDQINAIAALVSNAVGVNVARADTVHVTEMPFVAPDQPAKQGWWQTLPVDYNSIFKGMGSLVGLCAVFGATRKVKGVLLASTPSLNAPIDEAHGLGHDDSEEEEAEHEHDRLIGDEILDDDMEKAEGSEEETDEESEEEEAHEEPEEEPHEEPEEEPEVVIGLEDQLAAMAKMAKENPQNLASWIANTVDWNEK